MIYYIGDLIEYSNFLKDPYIYNDNAINVLNCDKEYVNIIAKDYDPSDNKIIVLIQGCSIPVEWVQVYE